MNVNMNQEKPVLGGSTKKREEDEINEQKNKGHRSLNKKLKKRRKQEKDVKKDKKLKKKEYEEKKGEYREHYFSQSLKVKKNEETDSKGVKRIKLYKVFNKFLKIYEDDIEDIYGIFISLDAGEEIEIQDIENPFIRKYLAKIFKYLKIKQKTGKIPYRKNVKTDFSLSIYIKNIVNDILLTLSQSPHTLKSNNHLQQSATFNPNSDNNTDSDSLTQEEEDEEEEEERQKNKQNPHKKIKKNSDSNEEESEDNSEEIEEDDNKNNQNRINPTKSVFDNKKHSKTVLGPFIPKDLAQQLSKQFIVGPSLISQEEKSKFLQNSLEKQGQNSTADWMIQHDLDDFLNDSFKEVEASSIKKLLQNKKVGQNNQNQKPQLPASRLAQGSAPLSLENVERDDEEAKRTIDEYEQKYRSKSLMEIHQENLQKKKAEQRNNKETTAFKRPFDRTQDLVIKKIDTKKLLAQYKQTFEHGPKFYPAKN